MKNYIVVFRAGVHEHAVVVAGLPDDTTPRDALNVVSHLLAPPTAHTTVTVCDDAGHVQAEFEYTPPTRRPLSDTLPADAAALLRAMQAAPAGTVH